MSYSNLHFAIPVLLVASWAGRDYYGRWKAQQYYSKAAYGDILVSPVVMGDSLTVNVVSDRRNSTKGRFTITAMTLDGKPVFEKVLSYTAKPLTSETVFAEDVRNLLNGYKKGDLIFYTVFETDGKIYDNIGFANKQKYMSYQAPDYSVSISPADGGYDVTIGTDVFARAVFLSLDGIDNFFSDNYFNILPGKSRTIRVTTPLNESDFRSQLKIISMGDIHNAVPLTDIGATMHGGDFKPLGGN